MNFLTRRQRNRSSIKAIIDIEDVGDVSLCQRCPAAGAAPSAGGLAACFAPSGATGEGNGSCTRGAPFPECAVCVHRGGKHRTGACAACDRGFCVVTKNTFLTVSEEEERP